MGFDHLIPELADPDLAVCPELDLLLLKPFEVAQQGIVLQIGAIVMATTDKDFLMTSSVFGIAALLCG